MTPVTEVSLVDTPRTTITRQYDVHITAGSPETGWLNAGLRRRTLLAERYFRQLLRVAAVPGRLVELANEIQYPVQLVDDELTQFLYHSSQIICADGVEYAGYGDDWETIKRKFTAYIATPGIDDLWGEINKAINQLELNPDPVTAPGVDTQKLDPKPE